MRIAKAITNTPVVLSDRIVTKHGYDEKTQIVVNTPESLIGDYIMEPTRDDVIAALKTLWRPFSLYKLDGAVSRAGLLGLIMGIPARAGLDIAPGGLFTAPCASSGKTIMATALGTLIVGRIAPTTIFTKQKDEELLKKLVGNALRGDTWFCLDNVSGFYSSAALASILTSGQLNERLLGSNAIYSGDLRMTFAVTGNNASISQELTTRLIPVRIDTESERPQSLAYGFHPAYAALEHRTEIIRAIITCYQAWFNAGAPKLGAGAARMATWSSLVRQATLWLSHEGFIHEAGLPEMGDPAHGLMTAGEGDDVETTQLRDLFHALRDTYEDNWFGAKEVTREVNLFPSQALHDAVSSMAPRNGDFKVSTVGSILTNRKNMRIDGMVLVVRRDTAKNSNVFKVALS